MVRDAESTSADPVDLIRRRSLGELEFLCSECNTLQLIESPLPVGGAQCAACGAHIGTYDVIEYASLQSRLIAFGVDIGFTVAFYVLISFAIFPFVSFIPEDDRGRPTDEFLMYSRSISLLVVFLYVLHGGVIGASLGKFVTGLRIVRKATMHRPGILWGLFRTIAKTTVVVTLGAGYVMMIRDQESRALHDRIAGTRVVHRPMTSVRSRRQS